MGRGTRGHGKGRKGRGGPPSQARRVLADPREENEVFDDLRKLAQSPGFIHALAALTFKSNVITAVDEFTADDFLKVYHPDRLIRTETNLLIGLMLSAHVDSAVPTRKTTMEYVERAVALLEELHFAIVAQGRDVFIAALQEHAQGNKDANPLNSGVLLREAIFYGGESAFPFQYEALARERYAADGAWMRQHLGFDIEEAADVMAAIRKIVTDNFPRHQDVLRTQSPSEWSWLPLFTFTVDQVLSEVAVDEATVRAVVEAFTLREGDPELSVTKVGCYNKAATHPLTALRDGTLISFLEYGAFAALYENPFYWIAKDKKYLGQHSQTRGSFVEKFSETTLCSVFPRQYVHRNVIFKTSAGATVGEADAILLYGYRAFIVQAKSKRLTLASWQGDDTAIANDFRTAVQEAYDQAVDCVRHIKGGVSAYADGKPIDLRRYGQIREFYPICITSEHYPALAFQSSASLKLQDEAKMMLPIITDVFTLDVMAEMLKTPLYFTDYMVKRANAVGKLQVSHELVALSWYIKKNLHIEDNEFIALADDFMVELDLSMAVRKLGIDGKDTPEGQLTRFNGTPVGKLLEYVDASDRPDIHRLGEALLAMNGEAADALNKGISKVMRMTRADHQRHDISIGLKGGGGITVHCNEEHRNRARALLSRHCELRKYAEKADQWYGITVDVDGDPIVMTGLEFPWVIDAELEEEVRPLRVRAVTHSLFGGRKIGRNELCPCGSGKKYKKCCLNQ